MAGFTYTELKTAVQNYLDNTETTFVNTLNYLYFVKMYKAALLLMLSIYKLLLIFYLRIV